MNSEFDLVANALGQLVLTRPGEDDVVDVRPRLAFPWSADVGMVSVRSIAGKEILLIEDPGTLLPALRERLQTWMAANAFVPTIRTVTDVNNDFGYQLWTVVTDRGPAAFRVQEREDVRFLPDGRFSIKDADGNVYVMPPVDTLDAASRRAVLVVL